MDFNNMYDNQGSQQPCMTKTALLEWVKNYVQNGTGVFVTKVEKVDDLPQTIRHSCHLTGVCLINRATMYIPVGTYAVEVPYCFCTACGKLYVPKDLTGGGLYEHY